MVHDLELKAFRNETAGENCFGEKITVNKGNTNFLFLKNKKLKKLLNNSI